MKPITEKEFLSAYLRLRSRTVAMANGCRVWLGRTVASGYGQIRFRSKSTYIHRLALYMHGLSIPEGHEVDHLCRNRRCCNPDHLEVVTKRENIMRSTNFSALKARQTHCIHGHELSGRNLVVRRNGTRSCRQCKLNATQRWYDKHQRKT